MAVRGRLAAWLLLLSWTGSHGLVLEHSSQQVEVRVKSTLQDLLRSVQDESSRAAKVSSMRYNWCNSSVHNISSMVKAANASMAILQTHVDQHAAASTDVESITRQLKADIAQTGATLQMTEAMAKQLAGDRTPSNDNAVRTLQAMVDLKRQGLASLEAELQVTLPAMAQMQARVAEAECRLGDRGDSIAAAVALLQVVDQDCSRFTRRANIEQQAREAEVATLSNALNTISSQAGSTEVSGGVAGVSFLQTQSHDDVDDLQSFLYDGPAVSATPAPTIAEAPRVAAATLHSAQAAWRKASVAAPKVSEVLSQLKAIRKAPQTYEHEEEWCTDTRHEHELIVRLAKDSLGLLAQSSTEHNAAATSLQADLESIDRHVAELNISQSQASVAAAEEEKFMTDIINSRQLALKILKQSMALFAKSQKHADEGKNVTTALRATKVTFEKQLKQLEAMQRSVKEASRAVAAQFAAVQRAQGQERISLEYLHGEHTAQQTRGADSKQDYEAEVTRSQSFLQKLAVDCSADGQQVRDDELRAQVDALQDAQDVLKGKRLEDAAKTGGSAEKVLSPLERAALALGVPVGTK